ncbi:toll/interleukin-1 receptor domain-containing protein [Desulfonema limicola]|uniref:toll/interleukin-1 receptor domain-containing protein n=1 Tax=Desulfonema limicola TaxID=45656 RepID=UPI001A9AA640|nr:toll/interleukin-1 receptor domain-containing protein [Desulfonema limicola]
MERGVVVTWLIDCKTAKVYTHKNPVSKIPPVIILPQYAYPGIRYIEGFLSGYVSNKFSNNFIYEIKQNEEKIKQKNNYVFISYANEDKIFAEHLYYDLQKAEIKVWIDTINIIPGQIRKMEIHKALTESRFYIPIISTNSVSKVGRFHSELRIALEILDKYPCTKTFIIPMRIEECSPLHPRIEEIHWVDMFPSWEDGINKIIKSIKHS